MYKYILITIKHCLNNLFMRVLHSFTQDDFKQNIDVVDLLSSWDLVMERLKPIVNLKSQLNWQSIKALSLSTESAL